MKMKLRILSIVLIISSIAIAQSIDSTKVTNPDSTEVINLQVQLSNTVKSIKEVQSELYEREKRLEKLYTNYSYLIDILKVKNELIEEKKKSKVK